MELLRQLKEAIPQYDNLGELLIFLLIVFLALYLLFQIIFALGNIFSKNKKKENKEKIKKSKQAKEKQVIELEFLEEDVPFIDQNPYYNKDTNYSYINNSGGEERKVYTYGDNYLYDYYNDSREQVNNPPVKEIKIIEDKSEQLRETEDLLEKYKNLPPEFKVYIINKILSTKKT